MVPSVTLSSPSVVLTSVTAVPLTLTSSASFVAGDVIVRFATSPARNALTGTAVAAEIRRAGRNGVRVLNLLQHVDPGAPRPFGDVQHQLLFGVADRSVLRFDCRHRRERGPRRR